MRMDKRKRQAVGEQIAMRTGLSAGMRTGMSTGKGPGLAASGLGLAVALGIFGAVPQEASAQDIVFSTWQTEHCFENGGWEEECVGASARVCMENTPGGDSTYGMSGCLNAEWQYWDGRLNAAYRGAMARARAFDVDNGGFGASVEDAMRQMQRAWIPFRDAQCDYEMSTWGGGTGGGPAVAECLMYATANQTLYLEYTLENP